MKECCGLERHTKSVGAGSPKRSGSNRKRFKSSSPGEGVENAGTFPPRLVAPK